MSKYKYSAKLCFAILQGFALLLLLNACSLQNNPDPTPTIALKIARVEVATPFATDTALPDPPDTPTSTVTPTATATPTSTATATDTPTLTPTIDPSAPHSVLGGTRFLARAAVLNLKAPSNLQISPALFGLNDWVPHIGPLVQAVLAPVNFTVLRYGGETIEQEPVDFAELDRFIADARAMNMEPLVQVPYTGGTPALAAKMVRYMNVQKHYDVRFWSIGNEEDKNKRGGAEQKWINSWRSYRDAMKAVDPRILIFGPEYAQAYDYTDPTNDWLTPFLKVNGDAVDVISLHRYPFNGGQSNPTVLVGDALNTARRVTALRNHIKSVTGRDIPLAFTEMNLSDNWRQSGEGSSASFSAGLWMAETLGQMAEAGVAMVNLWNARSDDSIGLVSGINQKRRPTYYAALLYGNYGNQLVPLASHVSGVSAHAARDTRTGRVAIVLVNRTRNSSPLTLDFDSNQTQQQGSIYFDTSSHQTINYAMPPQSMASFTFDSNYNLTRTILYSRAMFDQSQAPQVTP